MRIENFHRNILKQLVYQLTSIPETLEKSYEKFENEGGSADLNRASLVILLENIINKFSTIFIFVDAFDECEDNERLKIMTDLYQLRTSRVRILITGRPHVFASQNSSFLHMLQGANTQEISASRPDIEKYLIDNLEKISVNLSTVRKDQILEVISSKAEGQYEIQLLFISDFLGSCLRNFNWIISLASDANPDL
jgi:hypothetical protein